MFGISRLICVNLQLQAWSRSGIDRNVSRNDMLQMGPYKISAFDYPRSEYYRESDWTQLLQALLLQGIPWIVKDNNYLIR